MMTDYPTRAEIDAAVETLARLRIYTIYTQGPDIGQRLTYSALTDALAVLDDLAGSDPDPEPQPTAAEVLREACHATDHGTPERGITLAAMHYAEDHPEWFAEPRCWQGLTAALYAACVAAADSGNVTAALALQAAHALTVSNPDLFGGAA